MNNSKTSLIPMAIVIAGFLIAGAVIYINTSQPPKAGQEPAAGISLEEAGEKVINFVNQNLLRGRAVASLIESLEEGGLYKVKFAIGEREIDSYLTRDGKLFFPEAIDLTEVEPAAVEKSQTIGGFSISGDELCQEDEKPIVYFFGSKSCPHCRWEHPLMEKVMEGFKGVVTFHNNMDSDKDRDVFSKYSTGGIPALVLGCKYFRVGSGEGIGEEEETKVLTALTCKLTENQPAEACKQVQDLIDQVE